MNLRKFRTYAKNALLIALAMIVIAGATGLSYKAHYCHDRLAGIAFYTELGIQKDASCGCKDDIIKASSVATKTLVVKKKACCSDISYFNKLNIESQTNNVSSFVLYQPAFVAVIIHITFQLAPANDNIPVSDPGFRSPPLAGRRLVLFLSQQRIPLISYNC
jgi:hypothetical protein